MFDPKIIQVQKLQANSVGSKKNWVNKKFGPKKCCQKIKVQKNIWSKENWGPKKG